MLLRVKLGCFSLWVTHRNPQQLLGEHRLVGAKICPSCCLDDTLGEAPDKIKIVWTKAWWFLEDVAWRCHEMWIYAESEGQAEAAWARPVRERICHCQPWWVLLLLELFASQKSSSLPGCFAPDGLMLCTWPSVDTFQDIHPPLCRAASLNASMFLYICCSVSSWQLLCQLFLLSFSAFAGKTPPRALCRFLIYLFYGHGLWKVRLQC